MALTVTREIKVGRPCKIDECGKDTVVLLYNQGTSTADIATRFGVSVQTIRKILRERRN